MPYHHFKHEYRHGILNHSARDLLWNRRHISHMRSRWLSIVDECLRGIAGEECLPEVAASHDYELGFLRCVRVWRRDCRETSELEYGSTLIVVRRKSVYPRRVCNFHCCRQGIAPQCLVHLTWWVVESIREEVKESGFLPIDIVYWTTVTKLAIGVGRGGR